MQYRAFAIAAAVTAIAGCSKSDQKQAAAAPVSHDLAVTAADFSFQAPDTIVAGMTNVTLQNKGPSLHHVQFVRLDSSKTVADLMAAMKNPGPPPAWAMFVPGPNAPDPGSSSNEIITLAAGNYAIICLVDIPGGVPHFAKGMVHALVVKPAPANDVAQAQGPADVSLQLADYSFTLSKPLAAGSQIIEVTSRGPQVHEVEIVRFAPGKTLDDLGKWMAKPDGPPPANALGGTSAQMPGTTARFTLNLTPGTYAILCLLPDAKDGKPHMEHGMVRKFTIN